ncbi:MAG TPA: helix-turn-helix transcriptional regulator [Caulobacteraceae bacterium]|nr:helix-turn-helix transcriptional regulator [Caulobacteraceae bacterium]
MSYGDGYLVRSAAATYPDGWRLHRHDHPWGQLAFCNSGVMRVVSDAAAWLSPPTRAIWLPAGVAHEIVMKGEVATRFLYICPELAEPLPAQPEVLEVEPLLRELILHILRLRMLHPAKPPEDRLARLLIDLLTQARRVDLVLPLPSDRRALALAERLQDAPSDGASLAVLARRAGASLRTLQRLFPAETGLTLEAWRQKARLIWSITRLSAGAGVAIAAYDAGYESPSAFIAAFKRQFGVTPGRFQLQ